MGAYTNKDYNLTEKEEAFIAKFLSENGCGAQTPSVLLDDNFSCQTIEDIQEMFEGTFSKSQVAGLISSLEAKMVIWIEERDDMPFEKLPDLYWVDDSYLQSLDPELKFW